MHGMTTYFIRRLLFIPVTFVCITLLVYTILRLTPGGPIEQAQMAREMQAQGEGGAGASIDETERTDLSEEQVLQLRKYYKLDRSIFVGYLIWLGIWPDRIEEDGETRHEFRGILQGDFGVSHIHGQPVFDIIVSKFPISLFFGLIGYFATWIICVPLGVTKAIKHRTGYDTITSIFVFVGYSISGFVACLILLQQATHFNDRNPGLKFPIGGWPYTTWDKLIEGMADPTELVRYALIPLFGYLITGFATMTILMKNSLLENLGADYVRTAFAKGLSEKRVIFIHALRNSLIPITAGIGHALGLLFAGSFLIEKVCNIPGMGLLGYEAILRRNYPIIMGTLVFTAMIMLTGNIISDLIWALIDPRIRFGGGRK